VPALADPLPGQTHENRLLSDRLNVTLGGYQPDFNTDLSAAFGGSILGAFINVEQTLGVEDDLSVFLTTGLYRIKTRHAIAWTYTVLNRSGTASIDETISFGDPPQFFDLGANVETTFDSSLFGVDYRYSFINDGKIDAGVSAGLFTYSYDISLVGEAFLGTPENPGASEGVQDASTRVLAPLPAFGIFIDYVFAKNFVFRGAVRALNLTVGSFEGKYLDSRFTVDWYFYKHLGIGVGAAGTSIDFRDDGNSDPYRVSYSYHGYLGYFSIVF
jgi:hypothetical protein